MPWVFERLQATDVATIAAVAAAIAIGLFLLRPRPPEVEVSSHVLWAQVLPKRHNPLYKELIMLALQLLALIGLAAALGDPSPTPDDGFEGEQRKVERQLRGHLAAQDDQRERGTQQPGQQ